MDHGSAITKVGNLAAVWMDVQSSCGCSMLPTRITQEPELVMETECNQGDAELTNTNHAGARTHQDESRKTLATESSDSHRSHNGGNSDSSIFLENVIAHPPLGARASVERGVEVVVIIRAAEQGGS